MEGRRAGFKKSRTGDVRIERGQRGAKSSSAEGKPSTFNRKQLKIINR